MTDTVVVVVVAAGDDDGVITSLLEPYQRWQMSRDLVAIGTRQHRIAQLHSLILLLRLEDPVTCFLGLGLLLVLCQLLVLLLFGNVTACLDLRAVTDAGQPCLRSLAGSH